MKSRNENDGMIRIDFDLSSIDDYRKFLAVKALPRFHFSGRTAVVPAEYAERLGIDVADGPVSEYQTPAWMFDYQRDVTALAIRKRKFAIFAECGLGKTPMLLDFSRHASSQLPKGKAVLIVSPLMVVKQTLAEAHRFYGDSLPIVQVKASELNAWLESGTDAIGITNYEALDESVSPGRLGALVIDESSMLKSHYGKWGQQIIRLGKGLDWKLALTGTPAPNDRIEYANHAVFLDRYPTVNSFLARFFVNRGQTQERWALKPHALHAFYRALSDWCIFLTNPAVYGWKDNTGTIPPIRVHVDAVPLTAEQSALSMNATGKLFAGSLGGITSRSVMGQLAKGKHKGVRIETNKPTFIRQMVESWPDESTIIWCLYNDEQDQIANAIPGCASMTGSTKQADREKMIDDFKAGRVKVLVSKGKILGFGLNLQIATRQIFSGLQDSYENFHQCVKRSNRIGSTLPLNVHIPVTDLERPMIDTVLSKAHRVDEETREQEQLFKQEGKFYGIGA